MPRLKTVLLVVCLIIANASATIVLFTKVMNNEKLHTQLNKLSTNFNITSLEEKVDMKLSEVSARLNDNDNSVSKLRNILLVESCAQTTTNGIHALIPRERDYCSDGWTIFQRRMDGSIPDFHNKTWEEYSEGFGNLSREFWLGLRKLHKITLQGGCRLRVDMKSFDNVVAYAEYSQFSVADEADLFRISVGGYNGTAGDSLTAYGYSNIYNINGMAFSTNEKDNDLASYNCALDHCTGGWWNNDCFHAAPNGIYGEARTVCCAMKWHRLKKDAPMKFIQMGVRCD